MEIVRAMSVLSFEKKNAHDNKQLFRSLPSGIITITKLARQEKYA